MIGIYPAKKISFIEQFTPKNAKNRQVIMRSRRALSRMELIGMAI